MSLIARDAMTPTNESQTNPRFLESTSLKIKNSNSTLTDMPSPPLSPYTRNNYDDNDTIPALLFPRASKPLTSDLRYLEFISSNSNSKTVSTLSSNSLKDNNKSLKTDKPLSISNSNIIPIEKNSSSKDNNNNNNNNNNNKLDSNSVLHIDPYKYLNKKGFKKCQLNFLSEYQFKNSNSFNSSSYVYSNNINNNNNNNSTNKRQKSTIRHSYDSLKSNDNSNSDSEMEKPRTRRIVRQNNLELEIDENSNYDSSSISRPSTPIKRRFNNNNNSLSTPKRQRNLTPIVYNYDYKKIEDFCPPLNTLPSNNKCLKTDWKGQSMDLSNDPLIDELHPAEVVLASILRLPCAVYLDSKRRIFQEKVKRMKYNLPFRRTDAQKSCKIDVNKASRLFAAFEKVGWFNESHFQKFL